MTYMFDFDSVEKSKPRPAKRTSAKSNPLELTGAEKKILDDITKESLRLLDINGLSTSEQVNAMYSGIAGIEAILAKNWNGLVQSALMGLNSCDNVHSVSPYIFQHKDGANRNLASPQRKALKDMASRLATAKSPEAETQADIANCLRAMVCAAFAAERGILHIAKQNFGFAIRTLYHANASMRETISWTDELVGYAHRYARALVKMP